MKTEQDQEHVMCRHHLNIHSTRAAQQLVLELREDGSYAINDLRRNSQLCGAPARAGGRAESHLRPRGAQASLPGDA